MPCCLVRGTYCLMIELLDKSRIRVGRLGTFDFPAGVYVYVGSALGGIPQRVGRHKSAEKKMRWHIDYLLARARIVSTVSIPCGSKDYECAVAQTLMREESAEVVVKGFGASDCGCDAHLLYFGDNSMELVAESVSMRLSMLACVHPRTVR